ncbi:MAG: PA0069 family radical SAM protein [Deltaproteobacteria bacterium]|nr:PA0069 family radical SAM protein [Deltaproteobacteria bacterium]
MPDRQLLLKGRGTSENPPNRFEPLSYSPDPDVLDAAEDLPSPRTRLLRDPARTILTPNDSPDVGFTVSVNPYRGCEHGCIYCYARPTHEWLGFSAGLAFETQILVKEQAPRLLHDALASPTWQPQVIALSGVTDPYQPVERQLRLTRGCLEVLTAWRNPVAIVTKSALVTRDCDLLAELVQVNAVAVFLSITTLDAGLARIMEPRASSPAQRLEAISTLAHAGIPVGAMVAPIIPGLTDHEMPAILNAAAQAGARFAGHTIVRLPYSVGDLFTHWLESHYPDRKRKVLNKIRAIRQGKLNDARWHLRMKGEGIFAEAIHTLFALACRKAGLATTGPRLSTVAFRRPPDTTQLSLFSV